MVKAAKPVGRFFDIDKQTPVDADRAAGDQIFEALKQAILRMDIPPGSLISEVDVGRRFSASRTPVREAFMQLREAGMVITKPSRGNFVTLLSEARIREAQFIREALEIANVAKLCQQGLTEASRTEISDNLKRQKDCLSEGEPQQIFELDDAFHVLLARATGHERVAELLTREKMVLDRLRVLSLEDISYRELLYQQHLSVFHAITKQDLENAETLMREHLSEIFKTLSKTAEINSEYFE